jgi:hypothetical protein
MYKLNTSSTALGNAVLMPPYLFSYPNRDKGATVRL